MATRIIQTPRRIQSPGVQITETDLSRRPSGARAIRPAAMITGFAPQGPTDEVVKITSMGQFNTVFGLPETAAERYLAHTAEQLTSTGSDVYVTRMPYGANGGDGVQNYYSALLFPVLPHGTTYSNAESFYILPPKSILLSESEYETYIKDGNIKWKDNTFTSSVSTLADRTFTLNKATASAIFLDVVRELKVTDADVVNQHLPYAAYSYEAPPYAQASFVSRPLSGFNIQSAFNIRLQEEIDLTAQAQTIPNGIGKLQGAPTSWANVKTNISNLSSWFYYVSGNGYSSNVSYDILYHGAGSLNKLIASSIDLINQAGIIVVNNDKLSVNELFEGFYVALADNSDDTPYTDFQSITSVKTINGSAAIDDGKTKYIQSFYEIPEERLNFTLTESYSSVTFQSLSEKMSRYPAYDFSQDSFNDCLKLFLYKLNTTPYLQDSITLNYSPVESYVGSLYAKRQQNDPRGGRLVAFGLENKVDNNDNSRMKLLVNPEISQNGDWIDEYGKPIKRVRVADGAKSLWCSGIYSPLSVQRTNKTIGNLMLKLDRVFQTYELTENENIMLDIVCEAGLGTINAGVSAQFATTTNYDGSFDDTDSVDISNLKVIPKNWTGYYQQPDPVRDGYSDVIKRFRNYAQDRKNHVFVSDPLRYIFVNGRNSKSAERKTFNFVDDILRPMNVTYAKVGRSTYMATYANWVRRYDQASDQFTWLPASGFVGRAMLNAKKIRPWTAPAGFNYGRIFGVKELAINPNQRQRDLLYRSSYNPIVNFQRDGMAIYGQKTFINYQSAFDRLNVRNLFLHLEKQVTIALNRFVFEPNTIPTRNRVILRLTPFFEAAKRNEGLYDYRLICDERNNTPDSIDRNELRLAVYIQPVRTAEFILADFVATRTGIDLDDLIG
jgi:hypothetical protein